MNKSTSQETYLYSKIVEQDFSCQCYGAEGMFEKEIRLIKQNQINSEEKEYLISIS